MHNKFQNKSRQVLTSQQPEFARQAGNQRELLEMVSLTKSAFRKVFLGVKFQTFRVQSGNNFFNFS